METVIYKNKVISVVEKNLRIKGKWVKIAKIYENNAVVIIPIMANKNILIERQHRTVIGKWIYELPAGHVDNKEAYIRTAKRELREETGYKVGSIKKLFEAYPAPGIITQKQIYFIVEISEEDGKQILDNDEEIRLESFRLNRLLKMIKTGEIRDNKTIAALLYYAFMVKK